MPVMDGYTATRELRLMETEKNLRHQAVIGLCQRPGKRA